MRPFKQWKVQNFVQFRENTPLKEHCHTEPSQPTSSRRDSENLETNQSSSSIIAFRPSYEESNVAQFKHSSVDNLKQKSYQKHIGKLFDYEGSPYKAKKTV